MQRIIKRIETKRVKPWLYSEMQYARYKQFLKIKNSISPPPYVGIHRCTLLV